MTAAGRTTRRSQSQHALAARRRLREKFARTERITDAFLAADEAAAGAERRRAETIAQLDGEVAAAQRERTTALAALAVTLGSNTETAAVAGVSEREVREARRLVGDDDATRAAEHYAPAAAGPSTAPPSADRRAAPDPSPADAGGA